MSFVLLLLLLYLLLSASCDRRNQTDKLQMHQQYLNQWSVKINSAESSRQGFQNLHQAAQIVADRNALQNLGQIGELQGHFLLNLKMKSKSLTLEEAVDVENALEKEKLISWYSREIAHLRRRRAPAFKKGFIDPLWSRQWYLHSINGSKHHLNVTGVWTSGITGAGVTVAVLDDGIEYTNEDLRACFSKSGSFDFNHEDKDPMPSTEYRSNNHGTRCAGEIAAQPNNYCGVGIAFGAKVSALQALDGPITDVILSKAMNYKWNENHIYSISWGPFDNGFLIDGPRKNTLAAMEEGIRRGRHGLGSIYVSANGNGGSIDDCNYDGYNCHEYTLSVGGMTEDGGVPLYSENCACQVLSAYGGNSKWPLVTTDWHQLGGKGCTVHHTGTSAAAPLVAGIVALVLQARPCLSWRDVQHVMLLSADPGASRRMHHYQKTDTGLWHSHVHGYGRVDAWRAVQLGRAWPHVPRRVIRVRGPVMKSGAELTAGKILRRKCALEENFFEKSGLRSLEYVHVWVNASHPSRGQLQVSLTSPAGTFSLLARPRPLDNSTEGLRWRFTTIRCWGETPWGKWVLQLEDYGPKTLEKKSAVLYQWQLSFSGSEMTQKEILDRVKLARDIADGKSFPDAGCAKNNSETKHKVYFHNKQEQTKYSHGTMIFLVVVSVLLLISTVVCLACAKRKTLLRTFVRSRKKRVVNKLGVSNNDTTDMQTLLNARDQTEY